MEDLIAKKSIEYADSKLDESSTISIHEQKKMECFDWADLADAFEAGAEWYRNQLRKDLEDGIREINEKGFATFLKNHQSVFVQDANGDMMRKVDELPNPKDYDFIDKPTIQDCRYKARHLAQPHR